MKISSLCSLFLFCATAAFAQTSSVPPAAPAASAMPNVLAVTGCVVGGTKSEPVTLSNAMVLPFGSPALMPDASAPLNPPPVLPDPTQVSAAATQPQSAQPTSPAPPKTTAPAAIGTSGTVTGTAPAGSSASSVGGYRLSGVDMTSWIGRRVEVTGTVVPTKAVVEPVPVDSSAPATAALVPEFRVLSVQPVTGPCPK